MGVFANELMDGLQQIIRLLEGGAGAVSQEPPSEIVFGWSNIAKELWPGTQSSLMCHAPELLSAGVVYKGLFGRHGLPNNPRRTRVWCYRSTFKTWVMVREQKARKGGKR